MSGILGFITSFPTLLHSAVIFGTVIMFGAMGEILAEKAGNLNLGVPGIMYLGGIAGLIATFMYENVYCVNAGIEPNVALCIVLGLVSAFAAAALGGLTSLIEMPNAVPAVTDARRFKEQKANLESKAYIDFAMWALCLGRLNNDDLKELDELGVGKIASVSGRYYAMDRDNNWDREEKAYAAFVYGEGEHAANAAEAIEASYAADKTDEFVLPCVTCEGGRVQDGDTVIFMNFRPDRARQMTRIFCDDAFTGFERRGGRKQVNYVCMAEYDATMPNCEVAYPPVELKNVLGQYLSENGKTQLRIAETEKYAHVTFFFNGGVEAPYEGEDRCVIPSPKVATYDLKPEMSAPEVAAECKKRIESGKYDVIILNFANCDMVGHTGVFEAAVKAVEAVDAAVKEVVTAVLDAGGCAFLTADHGNAEKMKNPDGTPFTAHTTNVVPFVAIGCGDVKLREGGCLADIAPTMLPYIGLPVPAEMSGKSIIVE